MNWKLRQLEGFLAAARLNSFSAAADKLAMTQPSFSQLIRELETSLGVKLIERSTRRFELTEAGQSLLATIEHPLDDLQHAYTAMRDFAAGKRGRIAFCSVTYGFVVQALSRLKVHYPSVTVRLIEDQNLVLINRVLNREVDFGIGALVRPHDELIYHELLQDELMVVYPAGHPLGKKRTTSWRDFATEPLVLRPRDSSTRAQTDRGLMTTGVTREPDYDVANPATALSIVRAGLGITLVPRAVLAELNMKGLRANRITNPHPARSIGLIRRADRSLSPAAAAYVGILIEEARKVSSLAWRG